MTNREKSVWFAALAVVGLLVYFPGLDGKYFADDFKFVFDSPSSKLFYFYTHANPHAAWYRPIEATVLALIQTSFGHNTLPVHILVLSCHVLLSMLVFHAMVSLGFSKLGSVFGAMYMLISQANALAVLSNDTLSQVAGTLLGCVSLWFFWKFLRIPQTDGLSTARKQTWLFVVSLSAFVLSLWLKETSTGFLAAILALAFVARSGTTSISIPHRALYSLGFVLVTLGYLVMRASVMQFQPDPRYSIHLGLNILENAGLLLVSALITFSSAAVFTAFRSSEYFFLVAVGATSMAFLGIVLYGLVQSQKRDQLWLILVVGLAILLPAIMIQHTSELYIYSAMPLFSILVGVGMGSAHERVKGVLRMAVVVLGVLLVASHMFAVQSKALHLVQNGERAQELLKQTLPFVSQVPGNGTLVLVTPTSKEPEYSVYLMRGFRVIGYGENILNLKSRRDDFKTWNLREEDLDKWPPPSGSLLLTLVGDSVKLMNRK